MNKLINFDNFTTLIIIFGLLLLGYILITRVTTKENFGTDLSDSIKSNIGGAFEKATGESINKIKGAATSLLTNPENLDPTGTVRFVINTVPGARSTMNGINTATNLTIKAGGETITTLSNMTNGQKNGFEKIFKGDPVGGLSEVGTSTLNGVTESGKIVGFLVKDQAINIGNTVVNISGDIKNGLVDLGNTLSNTFSGTGPALKQFGDDTKRTFEDYGRAREQAISSKANETKAAADRGDVGGTLKGAAETVWEGIKSF